MKFRVKVLVSREIHVIAISSNTLKWMSIEIGLQVAKLGKHRITRYTQAHYASRSLLDVDMHCMEGRGLWSHANSCGVSL